MKKINIIKYLVPDRAAIFSFLIVLVYLLFLKFSRTGIYGLIAALALILFTSLSLIRIKKTESYIFGVLCALTFFIFSYFYFYNTLKALSIVRDWDFFCFYLYGKLASTGLNFYDPANIEYILSTIETPFKITQEFYEAVIQVGFPYPPMTMILFAPLGFLDLGTANILWKIFVLFFLFLDIILIIRIFKTNLPYKLHIVGLTALTLIYPGTLSVISFWQTNFLLLFFLLLTINNSDNWKSGMFMAFAILIKPLAAVWCLYFIIRKKWSALISLTITGVLVTVISVIIFGFDNFLTYFTSPPTLRMPQWTYTESINQSLFAVLSRLSTKLGLGSVLDNLSIPVIVFSSILVVLTCIASYTLGKSNQKLSFLIFIPLSLIIYPGSLSHYSVLLLPVFYEILSEKEYMDLQILSFLLLFLFVSGFIVSFIASFIILIVIIIFAFIKPQSRKLLLFDDNVAVASRQAL